ncbi:hypothetical protein BCL57_001839 [Agromyces flavus]|uniref:DUF998 domain-containing protein n=1 Tax=Agromyces flavus TaxID=589382 RepID=A0A1H1QT97_9MICO|nr:hypothetical protein [Agromyces flavus]MCP2367680.1 hypothetical protein [Agromyces flavus]GGI47139.1 hypothetical protein GCM10010932_18270 [Agromyces flavus]SDS26700.1 hypothetical protein SAMN04489721_1035 [Agromyces flavus]
MRTRPSRTVGAVLALIAAAWAFVLLPPQQAVWSGAYAMPRWLFELNRLSPYDAVRDWLVANGQPDFYLVFGAAASASFLLIWLATGPAFAALGWSGRALGWLVLLGAAITLLSYLNHPDDAPLHALWGAEAFVLIAIGLWAVVVAIAAPRRAGIPAWERVVLGCTLPILVLATLGLSYYPHGTLVGLGLEAAALAAWGARPPRASPATVAPEPGIAERAA